MVMISVIPTIPTISVTSTILTILHPIHLRRTHPRLRILRMRIHLTMMMRRNSINYHPSMTKGNQSLKMMTMASIDYPPMKRKQSNQDMRRTYWILQSIFQSMYSHIHPEIEVINRSFRIELEFDDLGLSTDTDTEHLESTEDIQRDGLGNNS